MDLSQRISNVAAETAVGKNELDLNKLYPITCATRFFGTKVVLLFRKTEDHATILYLNKEYSDVFTDDDIKILIHIEKNIS
jgi:hypothetical protein